jgi:hypothetical protein
VIRRLDLGFEELRSRLGCAVLQRVVISNLDEKSGGAWGCKYMRDEGEICGMEMNERKLLKQSRLFKP